MAEISEETVKLKDPSDVYNYICSMQLLPSVRLNIFADWNWNSVKKEGNLNTLYFWNELNQYWEGDYKSSSSMWARYMFSLAYIGTSPSSLRS